MKIRELTKGSLTRIDMIAWLFVFVVFGGSAMFRDGNLPLSLLGAIGIIVVMFFISLAIVIIIEFLKSFKGIGTLIALITNGPEFICLLAGIFIAKNIAFAASAPLGSNLMNPILLIIAAIAGHQFLKVIKTNVGYIVTCTVLTVSMALLAFFYLIPNTHYLSWLIVATPITLVLFFRRPADDTSESGAKYPWQILLLAIAVLGVAGYLLDPVVSFTADSSNCPKGFIGFIVLSLLSSWPEFKSVTVLLQANMIRSAQLNILVSNITNLWLAELGAFWGLISM